MQTGTLKTDSPVRALSWNLEGTRLLTAGALVQLWHLFSQTGEHKEEPVKFTLGEMNEDDRQGQFSNVGIVIFVAHVMISWDNL